MSKGFHERKAIGEQIYVPWKDIGGEIVIGLELDECPPGNHVVLYFDNTKKYDKPEYGIVSMPGNGLCVDLGMGAICAQSSIGVYKRLQTLRPADRSS